MLFSDVYFQFCLRESFFFYLYMDWDWKTIFINFESYYYFLMNCLYVYFYENRMINWLKVLNLSSFLGIIVFFGYERMKNCCY